MRRWWRSGRKRRKRKRGRRRMLGTDTEPGEGNVDSTAIYCIGKRQIQSFITIKGGAAMWLACPTLNM